MSFLELLLIAFGMAADAFAVCLVAGTSPGLRGPRPVFRLAFHFGLFQFLMPVLGWLSGTTMAPMIRAYDHWIAFALLAFVGIRMINSAWQGERNQSTDPTRGWTLVLLSIAVSIDALAIGLSLGLLGIVVWYPALLIGVVTSLLSLVGLRIGNGFGSNFGRPARAIGGIVLIGIGLWMLVSNLAL